MMWIKWISKYKYGMVTPRSRAQQHVSYDTIAFVRLASRGQVFQSNGRGGSANQCAATRLIHRIPKMERMSERCVHMKHRTTRIFPTFKNRAHECWITLFLIICSSQCSSSMCAAVHTRPADVVNTTTSAELNAVNYRHGNNLLATQARTWAYYWIRRRAARGEHALPVDQHVI